MCVLIEFLVLGLHSSKQQKSRFVVPMGSIDWGYGIARPSIIDRRRMLIASKEEAGESDSDCAAHKKSDRSTDASET